MSAKTTGPNGHEAVGFAGADSAIADTLSNWCSRSADSAYARNCSPMARQLPADLLEATDAHRIQTDDGDGVSATDRVPVSPRDGRVPVVPVLVYGSGTHSSLVYQAKPGRVPDVPIYFEPGFLPQTPPKNGCEWVRRSKSAVQPGCARACGLEMTFPRLGTTDQRRRRCNSWSEAIGSSSAGVPILQPENGREWVRGFLEAQRRVDARPRPP